MSQSLQPLSAFTKKIFFLLHKIFFPVITILVFLGVTIAALFVRRQTLRHEPQAWSVIRKPLLISTVILGVLFWYKAISVLASMGGYNFLRILFDVPLYLLIGAGVYGISLHYKKVFSLYRIRIFVLGFLIGCVFFVLAFAGFRVLTEFILHLDPGYTARINRLTELHAKEA